MQDFSLFHPDNPIPSVDVFTNYPIEFDGLHDRSERCNVGGVSVRMASIPELIFLKRLADRPRDRDDVAKEECVVFVRSTTFSTVSRGERAATLGLP